MLNSEDFRDIVSGRRRGLTASAVRLACRIAEAPYTAAVVWRNHRYDRQARLVHRVAVPVISVGNMTVGGTGKTPLSAWLARWYRRRGIRVALISRGYGAEAGAQSDEALELEKRLPDVPHLQNPDRVAAAVTAVEELDSEVLLLDDAFQHRRIHRDLDIVLVDALEPFGHGHVFPRGLLREPLSGLQRADVIVLTRADLVSRPQRQRTWQLIRRYAGQAASVDLAHRPLAFSAWSGERLELAALAGERVAAFCGIGNPVGFHQTLAHCGLDVAAFRALPDHYPFGSTDVEALGHWAREQQVATVVCTCKDLVKLQVDRLGEARLLALEIGVEFLSGQDHLEGMLERIAVAVRSRRVRG